jgi:phosphatidylglycerophosphate synthase
MQAVKVNSLGKWKTALQMVALSALLLLHKAHNVLGREEHVVEALHWAARASLFVLWAGAFLAVRSCFSPNIASASCLPFEVLEKPDDLHRGLEAYHSNAPC